MLSEQGAPTPVAATRLRAPQSLMGPCPAAELDAAVKGSSLYGRYAQAVDRESAYEKLGAAQDAEQRSAAEAADRAAVEAAVTSGEPAPGARRGGPGEGAESDSGARSDSGRRSDAGQRSGSGERSGDDASLVQQVVGSGMFKSLARSVGTQLGREISRSLFGTARRRR